jgi:uncharacterized membrane protein YjjB (DUF3815 family)
MAEQAKHLRRQSSDNPLHGFALFYNTAWPQLWMATVGGMTGHGLRFLAMGAGCRLEAATFLGGLDVGVISAWMTRSRKMPWRSLPLPVP